MFVNSPVGFTLFVNACLGFINCVLTGVRNRGRVLTLIVGLFILC